MQIQTNVDLSSLNTLGLRSEAKLFVELHSLLDLHALLKDTSLKNEKWHILGGGSNLVLPSRIDGLVIKIATQGSELLREESDCWFVKSQAGEVWNKLVQWTLSQGYSGLENLSLIPGTVGAAPIQNIGAYGVEVKDHLWELTGIDLITGEQKVFSNADCHFGYRDSYFKNEGSGRYLIWDVTFRLPKRIQLKLSYGDILKELNKQGLEENPSNVAKAVIAIRNSKLPDPKIIGNAGSFFKNPLVSAALKEQLQMKYPDLVSFPVGTDQFKLAAGWLIDQSGWKGRRLGPVGMYEKQALVLVNHGGAEAADVWRLAQQVCTDVKSRFGVEIEPEPIRW